MPTLRLGIVGINGRMGRLLIAEVAAAGAMLVGGVDRVGAPQAVAMFDTIASLARECDVVLDFTTAATVAHHASALADAGTNWVLGTTGLDSEAQTAVREASLHIGIVQAANFSPGVTLLLAFAERLAAALHAADYDAEIIEMHHRQKSDAPSGTALALGEAVAAGRGVALASVARIGGSGQAGARKNGDIGFAALRGGQIVGEHSLSFTAATEQISLSHRAFDRRVFAAGAVRAAAWLHGRAAGFYTMRDVLSVGAID